MTKLFFLISLIFLFSSCATHQSRLSSLRFDLSAGKCEQPLVALEQLAKQEGKDQLLYLMEYGSALQICGLYEKSNEVLIRADKLSEQVDYTSISKVAGATLLNEEMIQYKGDIFERLFINVSIAINFLQLNNLDEAMVEVRKINEKYNKFSAEEKTSFELNSFSQYLAGLIYELRNQHDDSCIAYQTSYKLDKSFREVGIDAMSSCWRAKRYAEFERLQSDLGPSPEDLKYIKRKSKNEKIILFLQGLGPSKIQTREDRLHPDLLPSYSVTKKFRASYINTKKNDTAILSQPIYSVTKAAQATLEADFNSLSARRLGARVAKEVVADQVRQKDKTLGNVAWLVMVASERADLRNWSLLPDSVQTMRINPAEGEKIQVEGLNQFEATSEVLPVIDTALDKKKRIFVLRSIK